MENWYENLIEIWKNCIPNQNDDLICVIVQWRGNKQNYYLNK